MKLLPILFLILSIVTISLTPSIFASVSVVDVKGASQNCFNPDEIVVIVYANPNEMLYGPSDEDFTLLDNDRNHVDYFTVNGSPFLDLKSDWNIIYDELTRTMIEIPKSGTFYVKEVSGMGDSFEISTTCIPNPVNFEISSTENKIHLTGQIMGSTSNYVSLSMGDYWNLPVYSGFLYTDTNGFFSETFEFTNCSDMNPNKLTSKNLEDEWWNCYGDNYLVTHPLTGKYVYHETLQGKGYIEDWKKSIDHGQLYSGIHRFTISHDDEKYEQSFCLGSCVISNALDESEKLYFTSVHDNESPHLKNSSNSVEKYTQELRSLWDDEKQKKRMLQDQRNLDEQLVKARMAEDQRKLDEQLAEEKIEDEITIESLSRDLMEDYYDDQKFDVKEPFDNMLEDISISEAADRVAKWENALEDVELDLALVRHVSQHDCLDENWVVVNQGLSKAKSQFLELSSRDGLTTAEQITEARSGADRISKYETPIAYTSCPYYGSSQYNAAVASWMMENTPYGSIQPNIIPRTFNWGSQSSEMEGMGSAESKIIVRSNDVNTNWNPPDIPNFVKPQFKIDVSQNPEFLELVQRGRAGTFELKSLDNPFTQSNNVGIMNPSPSYNYGKDVFLSEKYPNIGNIPSELRTWN